jgi:hypothetical protein
MEDVTEAVFEGTDTLSRHVEIENLKNENIRQILQGTKTDSLYGKTIKPFFEGNQYFLIVTETFKDVRLVGAPPSAIGKFGGDTETWYRGIDLYRLFSVIQSITNTADEFDTAIIPKKSKTILKIVPLTLTGNFLPNFAAIIFSKHRSTFFQPGLKICFYQTIPAKRLNGFTTNQY